MKVLLLEDHEGVRESMELWLQMEGYQVTTFGQGKAALEYLRHHLVDLVILDWNMPQMSGAEFLVRAREYTLPLFPPQFVLFSGDPSAFDEAQLLGATQFLPKPFRPGKLSQMLIPVKSDLAVA